ncbi:rhamnan synthesis F family protein [Acidocella facilis]|uniref:rhamnan synthesis F family protein n=1 Tax=Acidocella facilis TaxID=525 RepID=UPI000B0D9E20|nr:rhamnan synthesis F family protein [Acidocella facilis]
MKRIARRVLSIGRWYFWVPLARLIGWIRSPRQTLSSWPEAGIALGPRVVLFMHYDGRGGVRAQVFSYLRALRASGRDVVFVSNAGKLNEVAQAELREICAGIILRRNVGYDFGAWRDAIDRLGLPRAETEEVILANDSVFGPLLPLGDVLRRLDYTRADIWGLTESWQLRYHLQSYFLAFGPAALRAKAWRKFWNSVRPVPAKPFIVHRYEVGITQAMMKGGLLCAALWPYETLTKMVSFEVLKALVADEQDGNFVDPVNAARLSQVRNIRDNIARRVAMNPTSDLWRQLLLTGFPFIKRELLRDNPSKVQDVGDWKDVVRDELGADPGPIEQDLRLMLKGGAP